MTHSSPVSALLPCPFCGSDQVSLCDTGVHWVRCECCDAEGPTRDTGTPAAKAWNTRAPAQAASPAMETSLRLCEHAITEGMRDLGLPSMVKRFKIEFAKLRESIVTPPQAADDGELVCTQYALTAATTAMREAHEHVREGIRVLKARDVMVPAAFHNAAHALHHAIKDAPAAPQAAPRPGTLTEDQIMQVIRRVTSGEIREMLTCKRWKDGIDIDQPTFAAERLAEEFRAAVALSRPDREGK